MFIPISIDDFIKEHLENSPGENEKVLRVRLEEALVNYRNGVKCTCGKVIWVVGAVTAWNSCFSCNTGKKQPAGDYEIDSDIEKQDENGRRHIDEMDPCKINGMFDDAGYEINPDFIKKPTLCLVCLKNIDPDWEEEMLCNLNRNDQAKEIEFKCGAFEKL
jgi:hypothetical protein